LFNRRVYHFSQPFDYSGIDWGWIHIGLSLDSYDRSLNGLYHRTALLALVCTILGLLASIVYAKHLVRPVLNLQRVVQRVADGDLSARAEIAHGDEIGQLAISVNSMTEALLLRDRTLKEANENLEQRVVERTRELQDEVVARERAHRELEEAQRRMMQLSREAGMAEVATGVLHNVGNVLTSINVSANILSDTLADRPRLTLLKQMSPAASEGPTFTSITGDQGPTRWRGDGSSRCPLARGWRRASATTVAAARGCGFLPGQAGGAQGLLGL
jgi:methyl-accepting chemotaxis protein